MELTADRLGLVVERVFAWRMQSLLDMGFAIPDAEMLAGTDADLHDARRLIEAGCPTDLAVEILR